MMSLTKPRTESWNAGPEEENRLFKKMNWTSTKVPLWQIDCDAFRKVKREFELRDVTTEEHEQFVLAFYGRYDWKPKQSGTTVTFFPPAPSKK